MSCSNSLEISYVAPKSSDIPFRGFNLYIEEVEEATASCPTKKPDDISKFQDWSLLFL